MRTLAELRKRIEAYGQAAYFYDPTIGCIVWHYSTGDNIEVLFIESAEEGQGNGRELYRRMAVYEISLNRHPYHSVFSFRLKSNDKAERFYDKFTGWHQIGLGKSIYGGEDTVLMWTTWNDLLEELGISEQERNSEDTLRV